MKVIIFLAFVGTALGACDMAAVDTMRNAAGTVADIILSDCRPNDQAFSELLKAESCVALFNKGKCYYDNAVTFYGGEDVVTYGKLKIDLPHLQSLGNVLCVNVELCYTPIKAAVLACSEADAGFKDAVITKIQSWYSLFAQSKLESYAAANDDAVVGTLVQIALSRFTSVDDVITMFDEYTADTDAVVDAESHAATIKLAAQAFCSSGCTDVTAHFLKKIYTHLHKAVACPDAVTFCGGCANKAAHFMNMKQSIPCCLRDLVDSAIGVNDIVQEKYAAEIAQIEQYVSDQFAEKPALLAQIETTRVFVTEQVVCLKNAYDNSPNACPVVEA